jgi:acetyltransferase
MSISADKVHTNPLPRYPAHLVESRRLPDGTHVLIRPIHPDDDALERSFIAGLSSETRYNRLLGARKLTAEEIRHLTRIDYRREMAFVALSVNGMQAVQLGVARYVKDAEGTGAEFALVVADAWQRKGVGTLLLGALLAHARAAGIGRLHGIRLAGNQAMHELARKLGFAQSIDPRDASVRQVAKILTPAVAAAAASLADCPRAAAANDENPRRTRR